MKNSKIILGFAAAAVAGAAIGMLLAPEKGSDLQKKLKDGAQDWLDEIAKLVRTGKSMASDISSTAEKTMSDLRSELTHSASLTCNEIMEADQEEKKSGGIVETTEDIFETYRKLMAINLVEYTSLGASVSVVGIIYLIFIVFALLFVGLGSAWWVGEALSNMKAGFFIVSGAYILMFLLVLLTAKKKIIPFIRNLIIKEIYDKD